MASVSFLKNDFLLLIDVDGHICQKKKIALEIARVNGPRVMIRNESLLRIFHYIYSL